MVALLATLGTACETVDEDERFIGPIENVTPSDNLKNILIEDFTGQKCINCPRATDIIHSLQNSYGKDRIIAVAIHGGTFALSAPKGLATEESKAYHTQWGVESWPKGMVNRQGGLLEFSAWSAQAIKFLQEKAYVNMNAENSFYNSEDNSINVNVELSATQDIDAKLQVWLIENGIIAKQIMPDGNIKNDYEHNHIFRATVNGMDGEGVNLAVNDTITKQYKYTISDKTWKPENMAIVSFVANGNGVLQVIETPVIK